MMRALSFITRRAVIASTAAAIGSSAASTAPGRTGLACQHHPQRLAVIETVEPLALRNARFGIRFRHLWVRSPAMMHREYCVAPVLMYCA